MNARDELYTLLRDRIGHNEAARLLRANDTAVRAEEKSSRKAIATPDADPLIVDRFDTAMEPAPEDPPALIIGAVAADGRPVALFFDAEARTKVAAWLTPAASPTVYRAEHPDSGIVLGTYSNREAAVAHCEALATREGATGLVSWVPDDGDAFSPEELTYFDVEYRDGDDVPVQTCTGYVVTPLEIASEYDEEADE